MPCLFFMILATAVSAILKINIQPLIEVRMRKLCRSFFRNELSMKSLERYGPAREKVEERSSVKNKIMTVFLKGKSNFKLPFFLKSLRRGHGPPRRNNPPAYLIYPSPNEHAQGTTGKG